MNGSTAVSISIPPPLLQTCFVVFVSFFSILKHPNKYFLTQYIYLILLTHFFFLIINFTFFFKFYFFSEQNRKNKSTKENLQFVFIILILTAIIIVFSLAAAAGHGAAKAMRENGMDHHHKHFTKLETILLTPLMICLWYVQKLQKLQKLKMQ